MKVIFLDFDGVLNTEKYFVYLYVNHLQYKDEFGHIFDPEAVANLKRIIEATDAKIVVSSTWRYLGYEEMQKMWEKRNLPGEIIGMIPDCEGLVPSRKYQRGYEIKVWLRQNKESVEKYVIIDDIDEFLPAQLLNFVEIDYHEGITAAKADEAIGILMQNA